MSLGAAARTMADGPAVPRRWIALAFVCLSLLVLSLNNTSLNVAIPTISTDLQASTEELQWILDAYLLVFAALMLTMGTLGDRYGRKLGLLTGLAIIAAGSLLAAVSGTVLPLVAGRGIMGLGAALVMPATLSIITYSFPDPRQRAQAIGLWAATFGLGSGLGPVVGGAVVETFGWEAVFLVTLPIIAVAGLGALVTVTDSRDPHPSRLDIPGVVLSIAGVTALVYAIIESGVAGWTARNVVVAFCLAIGLLGAFGWWEARARHPMLPVYLFRNPSFSGANMALTITSFSLFGVSLSSAQFFQTVQGRPALEAGLLTLPLALAMMVVAALSSRVAGRLGIKITVVAGMVGVAAGQLWLGFAVEPASDIAILLPSLLLIGAGIGLSQGPATASVMGSVPVAKSGVGSAMNDTARELGGALGVAVLGSILTSRYVDALSQVTALGNLPRPVYETITASIEGAHAFATQIPSPQVETQFMSVVNGAFTSGMQASLIAASLIVLAVALLVAFILPAEIRPPRAEDAAEAQEG